MFSDTEKAQIRLYLGYPDVYLDANSRLESAMVVVETSRPEVVTIVQDLLTKLAAVDDLLTSAASNGGLKRAEDIEWYQGQEIRDKRNEGRRLAGRLSGIFGVPIETDAFGSDGFQGYGFTSRGSQYGGPIRMG